ncbi:MAG TPA: ornithine cyclodeaminase family protein [Gammaproteobacteria bacterium]|nr:ornithine cyclodeaminase family protein [Gammaproteobacteria bacterium]
MDFETIASVYPANVALNKPSISAKMLLLDSSTGEVIAMMDGTYLTQLRTGALQGAATDILARKNAKIAVLFGTGAQAATQLEAMLSVRDLTEVRVVDINFERAQQFASTMQKELAQYTTHIVAIKNSSDAIKDADIITAVTTSEKPVFDGALVKSGAHVNGIGAYMPHMQELPALIMQKADKIIFDTNEGVFAEAGDIIIPLKSGMISQADFNGELGELILNKVVGRETELEITLFKAVGSAVLDIVTAHHIYVNALERKIGQVIEV